MRGCLRRRGSSAALEWWDPSHIIRSLLTTRLANAQKMYASVHDLPQRFKKVALSSEEMDAVNVSRYPRGVDRSASPMLLLPTYLYPHDKAIDKCHAFFLHSWAALSIPLNRLPRRRSEFDTS